MIITIDGPSGTGKSTVAQCVAVALGFHHFDTGAVYRALTWLMLEKKTAEDGIPPMQQLLKEFSFRIQILEGKKHYFVGSADVTEAIRSQRVTSAVSKISALKEVREALLETQRLFAKEQDVVFEGRDLGTVVFPQAEVKIFLTAQPEVRAERRLNELIGKNPQEAAELDKEKVLSDILRRDSYDSTRPIAPLQCPPDAVVIDTTSLSIDGVVSKILEYVSSKYPERVK
jgi:cytidylate kinase